MKMTKNMLFASISKVDEVQRTVFGVVTSQVLDKSGEVFDYESSKPYFKAWTENFEKVTNGKSLGNVRSMHQPNAVGKLIDIQFDDANKTITATAKIVDDQEWAKVQEGVYTGFSIGGKYMKRWEVDGVKHFTADPVEVSIVDNPCVPNAHFLAVKADGVEAEVEFKLKMPTNAQVAEKAIELCPDGGNWVDYIEAANAYFKSAPAPEEVEVEDEPAIEAAKADAPADEADMSDEDKKKAKDKKDAEKAKETPGATDDTAAATADSVTLLGGAVPVEQKAAAVDLVKQQWVATDGKGFDKKADCVAHQEEIDNPITKALETAATVIASVEKAKKPYGDVAYALEVEGVHKFPLDTPFHIRSSWVLAHKYTKWADEAAKAAAIDTIEKAWKDKIDPNGPPAAKHLKLFDNPENLRAAAKAIKGDNVQKSLFLVSWWAEIADVILCAADCVGWSHDDSSLPDEAKNVCAVVLSFLVSLVEGEVAHAMARMGIEPTVIVADTDMYSTEGGEWAATPENLTKVFGKLSAMGGAMIEPVSETVEKASFDKLEADLETQKAANVTLTKQVEQAVAGITTLTAQVEKLSKEPMPRPMTGRVVDKGADRLGKTAEPEGDKTLTELLEKFTPDQISEALIKSSQRNPQRMAAK